MPTIFQEHKDVRIRSRHVATQTTSSEREANIKIWYFVWKNGAVGLAILAFSILTSGVVYFQTQLSRSADEAIGNFHWLVLTQGDQLTIDEVGRFLRQYEGIQEVRYLPTKDLVERVKLEGIPDEDLELLEETQLPPAWQVLWSPSEFEISNMRMTLDDVRRLPGVVDVAYNRDILRSFISIRRHALQLKLVVSMVFLVFIVFSLVLLARLMFFGKFRIGQSKMLGATIVSDILFWVFGVFLCSKIIGPVPWQMIGPGILIALLHSLVSASDMR